MPDFLRRSPGAQKLEHSPFVDLERDFRLLIVKSRKYSLDQTIPPDHDDPQTPLDPTGNNADTQIYCKLANFTRGSCPAYIALSYEWGHTKSEQPVIVNGIKITVTANLQAALQHLVKEDEDLIIWIDAICINQGDDEEKATHIHQMTDIYSQATETVVWGGSEKSITKASIDLINDVVKDLEPIDIVKEMSDLSRWSNTDRELYDRKLTELDEMLAGKFEEWEKSTRLFMETAMSLRDLSYWNRVWIIQEFTVSSKLRLQWGRNTISSQNLHAFVMILSKFQLHIMFSTQRKFMNGEAFDETLVPLLLKCSEPASNMYTSLFGIRNRYREAGSSSRENLLQLLARTSVVSPGSTFRSQCKMPCDRIFGLLGIASDKDMLAIVPSYKKSASLIYQETAKAMILAGNVDVLAYSQFPKSDSGMPTWAPDWRQIVHRPCGEHPWDTAFKASGENSYTVIPISENILIQGLRALCKSLFPNSSWWVSKKLALRGVRIDTVSGFKNTWDFDLAGGYTKSFAPIATYLQDIQNLLEDSRAKDLDLYQNHHDLETAFYRIPIADQEMSSQGFHRRTTAESRVGYDLVKQDLAAGHVTQETMGVEKSSYWNMMEYLHGRRPFISEKGYVGLGPEHLIVGDVICLFMGAKLPYILRRSWTGSWTLVGEAYVHGIMYGEFMETSPDAETFSIH